ncbi:MAG TPA: zinc metallopeptidase [Kofleriaceae bacterium]|nr:zinc metallopeptidase [Kofleriaceae bacterium]
MIGRFLTLLAVVVFLGPLGAAFVMAPLEALGAWPAWTLTLVPAVFVLVAGTVYRVYHPLVDAPLPLDAAAWLEQQLQRLNKVGVSVVAMERTEGGHSSFYAPSARTIVLAEHVHGEHTGRAYATAAHELGHVILHDERPLLSRVLLAARGNADRCFYHGVGLLFGTVITGATTLRWLAFALIAAAVVLHALVVVDEIIASAHARDLLRYDLGDSAHSRIARGHLRRALATYVSILIAYMVPLAAAPWVLAHGEGLIAPGAPLAGTASAFATVAAWIVLVSGAAAVLHILSPVRRGVEMLAPLVSLPGICWAPLFAVLVCDQASMPAWAIALAVVPAWSVLSVPAVSVVRWFGGLLAADVDLMPLPVKTPIRRISRSTLWKRARDDDDDRPGVVSRFMTYSFALWAVPLALAWLGWL